MPPSDGFGLIGMRERVGLAGGTLELESAPGEGTTIVATLPARHRDESDERASNEVAARQGRSEPARRPQAPSIAR